MSILDRFLAYADDFEKSLVDDDWDAWMAEHGKDLQRLTAWVS